MIGEQFWDREKEIELFIDHILNGAHLNMIAIRRMGKTSLMKEAAERLKKDYICLFVDFQKSDNAQDAITELSLALKPYETLWEKTQKIFSNILDRLKSVEIGDISVVLRSGITEGNWPEKGDQLFNILADTGKQVIMFLDEVPILVNRILKGEDYKITHERKAQADKFMSWLRHNSFKHQGKVSIVVSGSIGFETILHQAHLSSTLNNFMPFELKPWTKESSIGCLKALANEVGLTFDENAPAEIVGKLGCCVPHHVQMFFTHVYNHCKTRKDMHFTAGEADEVYQREILSTRGIAELVHYEERLKTVLDNEQYTYAIDILSETAIYGKITRKKLQALAKLYSFPEKTSIEVQQEILQILEHDGYVEQSGNGYVFISYLLRDWWKRRYKNFHIPIMERRV